jgi:hypothetical protein
MFFSDGTHFGVFLKKPLVSYSNVPEGQRHPRSRNAGVLGSARVTLIEMNFTGLIVLDI